MGTKLELYNNAVNNGFNGGYRSFCALQNRLKQQAQIDAARLHQSKTTLSHQ